MLHLMRTEVGKFVDLAAKYDQVLVYSSQRLAGLDLCVADDGTGARWQNRGR